MLNVVILTGRLTADPELKTTGSGVSVCSFSLAVERRYRAGEERQADFINVVAWRTSAEFISKYFKKGQMMAVEGSLQSRKYQDKEGKNRVSYEVVANNVQFADYGKRDGGSGEFSENSAAPSFSNSGSSDFTEIIDGDDDLPF